MFFHAFIEPLLLVGFLVVVLFSIIAADGIPIARTIIVIFANIAVGILSWFVQASLTLLILLVPQLSPILQPGRGKTRGKSTNRTWTM